MTHRYTLLVGGTVLPGSKEPATSAIAWAEGTVLLLGSDEDVAAISRGDSHRIDLRGATVVPLGPGLLAEWPTDATLEIGGPADLAVLDGDPRVPGVAGSLRRRTVALVRGGRVVEGRLPGHASRHPSELGAARRDARH